MDTTMTYREEIQQVVQPIFDALPLEQAMNCLVVDGSCKVSPMLDLVEQAVETLKGQHPELAAGLWLYVDQLDKSHVISQDLETPTGSFWHAIMHRREGDFSNSQYWYRKVGHHPAYQRLSIAGGGAGAGTDHGGYDPMRFVSRVEKAYQNGQHGHEELIAMQRAEWAGLFAWCAEQ